MSLVTIAEARALINTSLGDADLQEVIDRVEAEITARIGAPQDDTYTVSIAKTLQGEGQHLFLPAEIYSMVSIVEDDVTLASTDYRYWSGGVIERLPEGDSWGDVCVVTYKPADDRPRRKEAIIDLARLALNRTAMQAESVAGEYSYTAPANWEKERRRILKRLAFPVAG
jgi:hypothetical protein